MLDRIVIGTANWGRDYNGHCVDEKEQNLIMEYMKEVGIEWLDVATAYGTQHIGMDGFSRIIKSKEGTWNGINLAHRTIDYDPYFHDGVSIYRITEIPLDGNLLPTYIEFPYSIMNQNDGVMAMKCFVKLIARSIFCKGKALKYFSPRECIDFVLMNPKIDKVIIGVDSVDQLRENIAHLVKMETFTHNEKVDTRKF